MMTARMLLRTPGTTLPVIGAMAAAVALSLVTLGLYRLESLVPPRLAAAARVAAVRDAGWGPDLPSEMQTPAALQHAAMDSLLLLLALLAAAALAIACASIAILLLGRATARRQETALRIVFGATPARLARELLGEGALLCGIGGSLGLGLGAAGLALVRASWPEGMAPPTDVGLAAWMIPVALTIPVLVTLAGALAPAAGRRGHSISSEVVGVGTRATAGRRQGRLHGALVIGQIAASLMLVTGAALLVRNALPLLEPSALGFEPRGLVTMEIDLAVHADDDTGGRAATVEALLDRVGSLPGVQAESLASPGTFLGLGTVDPVMARCENCWRDMIRVYLTGGYARRQAVGPGYFAALGVPLVRGREFGPGDREGAPHVAVVNRTLAEQQFLGQEALGRRIRLGSAWYTIVGIVGDIRPRGLGTGGEPAPAFYLSALQHPPTALDLALRTDATPDAAAALVAQALGVRVSAATTMERRLAQHAAPLGWLAAGIGLVAVLALVLATSGLFAVTAHGVTQRTREIAIRRALGAPAWTILAMILGQAARRTWRGIAWGGVGAVVVARLLQLRFHGIALFDPALLSAIALLLAAVTLLGSYVPARRAASVEPGRLL